MAVDTTIVRSFVDGGSYGPIEPITLIVLREELEKLRGTLAEDKLINHERCVEIADDFIEELGACINLSLVKYPDDQDVYERVFDGLQDIINLIHGFKPDLIGADKQPRLMDAQESRLAASDRLMEIMEDLAFEVSQREVARETARMEELTPVTGPKRKSREGGSS